MLPKTTQNISHTAYKACADSIDDLFDEPLEDLEVMDELLQETAKIEAEEEQQPVLATARTKQTIEPTQIDDQFEDLMAPTLPQEPEEDEEDIAVDIQKELEEKFDELFGAFEEEEEEN